MSNSNKYIGSPKFALLCIVSVPPSNWDWTFDWHILFQFFSLKKIKCRKSERPNNAQQNEGAQRLRLLDSPGDCCTWPWCHASVNQWKTTWLGPSVAASVSWKAALKICLLRLQERLLLPSLHRKSIAGTVCWLACLSVSWIACNPSSTPLLGCCATADRRKYNHVTPLLRDVVHWLPVPLPI